MKAKDFLAISGIIIGFFLYIQGFIIVNVSLRDLGIQYHPLLRTKYLSAGFLLIVILAVYFFFVWRSIYYAEELVDNFAAKLSHDKKSIFWGIFSMFLIYSDNAFGIVISTVFISQFLFHIKQLNVFWGFLCFFFLVDYPINKLKMHEKYPRFFLPLSCLFYVSSVIIFFYFVKAKEAINLFWMFVCITFFINLLLDLRKKFVSKSYITRINMFDIVWIGIIYIVLSITFGKLFYTKIDSTYGGGKPIEVSIFVKKEEVQQLKQLPIKFDDNKSEKVLLILQTESDIYIKSKTPNEKSDSVIQLNKNIVSSIIY
ncbi:MAG: hypothetical protein NTU69_12060 [Proteobacteria bacterium]|nr:hypothetical protein [Pseudomonadota bacterium]